MQISGKILIEQMLSLTNMKVECVTVECLVRFRFTRGSLSLQEKALTLPETLHMHSFASNPVSSRCITLPLYLMHHLIKVFFY